MGEWQVVGISFNNSYLTKTSWQRIADIIGGEVKTASEWGFTSISGMDVAFDVSTGAVYRPYDDCPYGLIICGWNPNGYPHFYTVPMTGGDVNGTIYNGGFKSDTQNIRVFKGDGFSVLANLEGYGSTYRRIWGFDTYHDEVNDTDFMGLFNEDMEVLNLTNRKIGTNAISGSVLTQNDGRLYVEIVKHIGIQISNSIAQNVFVSEHLYNRFFAYDDSDKNVVMNGIRFTNPQGSLVYFPTE